MEGYLRVKISDAKPGPQMLFDNCTGFGIIHKADACDYRDECRYADHTGPNHRNKASLNFFTEKGENKKSCQWKKRY